MIIPSKQLLLIGHSSSQQMFIFDPKTACIIKKITDENELSQFSMFYKKSNQILVPHLKNAFLNVWDFDTQLPADKISTQSIITSLFTLQDNILFLGSQNGQISLFQLPCGILLKKINLHSSKIIFIRSLDQGFLLTSSTNEISKWKIKDILLSQNKTIPVKNIFFKIDILKTELFHIFIVVLTSRDIKFYHSSSLHQISSIDITTQNPTCMCFSSTSLFVGNSKGVIKQFKLKQKKILLDYDEAKDTIFTNEKKIDLNAKKPLTQISFVESLNRLVTGSIQGELKIWFNGEVKNSLHLMKSPINQIKILERCLPTSFGQRQKIKSLHKFELNTLSSPIYFETFQESMVLQQSFRDQLYFHETLSLLRDQNTIYKDQVRLLKKQNSQLLNANLYYSELLDTMPNQ